MPLSPDDRRRLQALFEDALALPASRRREYLAGACPDNPALQQEVERLIAADERATTFLEPPVTSTEEEVTEAAAPTPECIGRYRIDGVLGEGGMGVVYAAHDERLDRRVALKMIRKAATDQRAPERLWREARAAASLNHPNVCQVYEVGEENGELFLAMELLDGESLAVRLIQGPLPCAEAVQITLAVLAALEALHRRDLVHRDLKPSNVFLTPHAVKLLDFGLARPIPTGGGTRETGLTLPGTIVGTPNYMAPEQVLGQTLDARTDVFAAGIVLFEMLCGRPPFAGGSVVRVLHAITVEQPPALGGSPAIVAADRVIHRALSKSPQDRYQTADAMAQALREALLVADTGVASTARPMTRLIALPLRILRSDPETDFLAFSLPDAITSSLSGLDSLIVRSSLAASRFGGETQDLKAIAEEADVDIVLTGTLLRAGEQLRVSTQLVEVPDGTLVWSQTAQLSLGDLFKLQDDLASRVVESLSLPLTTRGHRMLKDVPASARAYELYLRANQLAGNPREWALARDLYLECLREDSRYAPAWARLGRTYRVLAKAFDTDPEDNLKRAEAAFVRALEINPDLSIAHSLYAYLEIDSGRAQHAMTRLLTRAQARSADPELFAGLVHACRYCGLLDASRAADEQARRLDKLIRTSAVHTHFMLGDYQRALEVSAAEEAAYIEGMALVMLGRNQEAVVALRNSQGWGARRFDESLLMLLEGRRAEGLAATQAVLAPGFRDPESFFYVARQLAYFGDPVTALTVLAQAVENGFFCFSALARDPWLDTLRGDPGFAPILRVAEARHREALAAFLHADGDRLLGLKLSR